jgi:hypothetical protein
MIPAVPFVPRTLLNRLAEADRTIQGFNVGVRKWHRTPI